MNQHNMLLTPPPSPTSYQCPSAAPYATPATTSPTFHNTVTCPEDRIGWILGNWLKLTAIQGLGAYGSVYSAVDIRTNTPLAVKALARAQDERQHQFQRREIELHHAASHHPNVVSLYRIMETEDTIFVVLELCSGGDLFSNITERRIYQDNEGLTKRAFLQICEAVEFCHRIGIYHRDLKPENILLSSNGWDVKLADFGLATRDPTSDDFGCGSTFYMSPECHRTPSYPERYASGPNDVWSLGIILVNLTCSRNPWKKASPEDSTYRAYLKNPNFLQQILPISPELNMILSRIFEPDPRRRITIPELKMLVMSCPTFTIRTGLQVRPITPPAEQFSAPFSAVPELFIQQQSPPSPPTYSITGQHSASSSVDSLSTSGSTFSDTSNCSSVSSQGSLEQAPKPQLVVYTPHPPSFYSTCAPVVHCSGPVIPQHYMNHVPALC